MSEKNEEMNILDDINNQFKELIELIEKEKDSSFKFKIFNQLKKKNKIYSKKKYFIICCILLLLFISIYFILSFDELTYNIYFVFLSFIRLMLIKVRR